MSAASVTAYFSPTMARNFSIRWGGSGGTAGFAIFIFVLGLSGDQGNLTPSDRGAAQPVLDGFAEPFLGDRHHGDGVGVALVEGAEVAEQIGGTLGEIAALG